MAWEHQQAVIGVLGRLQAEVRRTLNAVQVGDLTPLEIFDVLDEAWVAMTVYNDQHAKP